MPYNHKHMYSIYDIYLGCSKDAESQCRERAEGGVAYSTATTIIISSSTLVCTIIIIITIE